MATIRVKKTKYGITYRIKAGKGEDLTDFVRALAGQPTEPVQPTDVGDPQDNDLGVPSREQP